ncbi:hypothetical protein KEM54_001783 [Ascosphaera aggregata]|nr:hypothetical protein KEM54_001783 [Ascosphaera aggregata]
MRALARTSVFPTLDNPGRARDGTRCHSERFKSIPSAGVYSQRLRLGSCTTKEHRRTDFLDNGSGGSAEMGNTWEMKEADGAELRKDADIVVDAIISDIEADITSPIERIRRQE